MNAMQDFIAEELASENASPAPYLAVPWLNLESGACGGRHGWRWESRHLTAGEVQISIELRCREGVVDRMHGVSKETARRVVACLHACEGISTEQLEHGGTGALKNLVDSAASVIGTWDTGSLADAVNMLEADLEKLKVNVDEYREVSLVED